MKILAIETSCDETAVAILDAKIGKQLQFKVLANTVNSQVAIHEQYGGVFPMMAKREHVKNIIPLFLTALQNAKFLQPNKKDQSFLPKTKKSIADILSREPEMIDFFINKLSEIKKPKIDAIAVTYGPGLEPALWVGISFAKALAVAWNLPLVPVNHMEGHILSVLLQKTKSGFITPKIQFPAISLLVSGGHTELVSVKDYLKYTIMGQTRDDAVGEAFDKVARMLGLPYPGGPGISRLAEESRKKIKETKISFPRPMLHSKDFDFSFSGLKTSILYFLRDMEKEKKKSSQSITTKRLVAHEFENAAIEVLVTKTIQAIKKIKAQSLIIGGGVAANTFLRNEIKRRICLEKMDTTIYFPEKELSTDNALMIAIVGAFHFKKGNVKKSVSAILKVKAQGNLRL